MILALFLLINAERITALKWDSILAERAHTRAEYLCNHTFSHAGFITSFKGYPGYVGENLSKNFKDATSTNAALMASPTHRANILNPKYHKIGIGEACKIQVELFSQ